MYKKPEFESGFFAWVGTFSLMLCRFWLFIDYKFIPSEAIDLEERVARGSSGLFFWLTLFLQSPLFMTRFVERNRRDVEEKSDQLKAISNLAALFCGFATVTLTQFAVKTEHSWVSPSSQFFLSEYGLLLGLGLKIILSLINLSSRRLSGGHLVAKSSVSM